MLRIAGFAFVVGLAATIPVVSQQQNKQETKGDNNKKKAEPEKKDRAAKNKDAARDKDSDERISRMKERNREIDRILNKPKK